MDDVDDVDDVFTPEPIRACQAPPAMTGRLALVTGASRGLGAAMAEALAPQYHIVALGRTTGALEELDDRIKARKGAATLAPLDVTDDSAMQQLCRSIHDRWGRVDLFVHAAIHSAPLAPVDHVTGKEWEQMLATNVRATGRLIGYLSPLLHAAPEARAVFLDDDRVGQKFFGAYAATKAAQIAMARAWAAETIRSGLRVDIVRPRPMRTAARARFFPGEPRDPLCAPADEAARILAELSLI